MWDGDNGGGHVFAGRENICIFFTSPLILLKKINKLVLKSKVLETVMVALHGECNDATKLCM